VQQNPNITNLPLSGSPIPSDDFKRTYMPGAGPNFSAVAGRSGSDPMLASAYDGISSTDRESGRYAPANVPRPTGPGTGVRSQTQPAPIIRIVATQSTSPPASMNVSSSPPKGPSSSAHISSPILSTTFQSSPVDESISNEAGALYFMQNNLGEGESQVTSPNSEPEDDSSPDPKSTDATPGHHQSSIKQPVRQDTPMAFMGNSSGGNLFAEPERSTSPNTRPALNRRPSGARGVLNSLQHQINPEQRTEIAAGKEKAVAPSVEETGSVSSNWQSEDANLNLLVANAQDYLDKAESSDVEAPNEEVPKAIAPVVTVEPSQPSTPDENVNGGSQYKSSFAPSKQAVERKLKSQAQQVAHRVAVQTPGRSNGKKKAKEGDVGVWSMSSDDEEEEEEEEEDLDSDTEPAAGGSRIIAESAAGSSRIIAPPLVPPPPPPPPPQLSPQARSPQTYGVGVSPVVSSPEGAGLSGPKPIRHLPQIPGKPAGELFPYFPSVLIVDTSI
jgi:CCR4-NOT transcriptional complex subunit CAF120